MAYDELWPTLQAFPGQIATLPSWWGGGAAPTPNPRPTPRPTPTPAPVPLRNPAAAPRFTLPPMNDAYGVGRNLGFMLENIGAGEVGDDALAATMVLPAPGTSTYERLQRGFGAGFAGADRPVETTAPASAAPQPSDGGLASGAPYTPAVPNSPTLPPVMLRAAGTPQFYTPAAEGPAAEKPAAKPEPIRALRLPNGKVIFTNQPSMHPGGEEVSRQDAGRDIRSMAAAGRMREMLEADGAGGAGVAEGGLGASDLAPNGMPRGFRQIGGGTDTSLSVAPILRRSVDLELERMMGRAPAYDPNYIGGSPATDETAAAINDDMLLERGGRELDKANLANALAFSKLPIEQQQAQQNPQIAVAQWVMGQMADIDASIAEANAIGDPQLRDRTIAELQAQKAALNQMFFGDFSRPGILNSGR